jgi:hypothetical protein
LYTVAILACMMTRRVEQQDLARALDIFRIMKNNDVQPDAIVYGHLIALTGQPRAAAAAAAAADVAAVPAAAAAAEVSLAAASPSAASLALHRGLYHSACRWTAASLLAPKLQPHRQQSAAATYWQGAPHKQACLQAWWRAGQATRMFHLLRAHIAQPSSRAAIVCCRNVPERRLHPRPTCTPCAMDRRVRAWGGVQGGRSGWTCPSSC